MHPNWKRALARHSEHWTVGIYTPQKHNKNFPRRVNNHCFSHYHHWPRMATSRHERAPKRQVRKINAQLNDIEQIRREIYFWLNCLNDSVWNKKKNVMAPVAAKRFRNNGCEKKAELENGWTDGKSQSLVIAICTVAGWLLAGVNWCWPTEHGQTMG